MHPAANAEIMEPLGIDKVPSCMPASLPQAVVQGLASDEAGDNLKDQQLPDFNINEELEDALDRQCVPSELIDEWAAKEDKALQEPKTAGVPLPNLVRDIALRFMSHFSQLMGLPSKSWFEAVTLLDIYCVRIPEGASIDLLPATCVALVRMLKKADVATLCMKGSNLPMHAAQLTNWLRSLGYTLSDVTEDLLNKQEGVLLQALGWQINLPSLESWMSTYCTRFNVLTRGLFIPSLNWVWEQSIFCARVIVMRQAATAELPPRRIAGGLLGLSFVGARLLPLEYLRSPKLDALEWEQLFTSSQLQGAVPTCILPPGRAQRMLDLLQVTVGINLIDLQEACARIATVIRDALVEIQNIQQAHNPVHPTGM